MGGEHIEGIVGIILGVLGLIFTILWIIMPFVVIAIKGRIDRLIELVSVNNEIALEANRLLDKLASEVESSVKR